MPVNFPAIPEPNEIHIWHINLSSADESTAAAAATAAVDILAPDEMQRAGRFAFDLHCNRFVNGRCALRRILGRYLGMDASDVPLASGSHGKPYLDRITKLGFNLTHAEELALLAVSGGAEIGIDIEKIRLPNDMRALAKSVFSAEENAHFMSLADDALAIPFFTCWTKKEAFLKALGTGLSIEATSVHVGFDDSNIEIVPPAGFGNQSVSVMTIAQDANAISSLAVVGGYEKLAHLDYDAMVERALMKNRKSSIGGCFKPTLAESALLQKGFVKVT